MSPAFQLANQQERQVHQGRIRQRFFGGHAGGGLDARRGQFARAAQGEREGTCANGAALFPDTNPGPGSLKAITVPEPTISAFVRDRAAAIVLGKALFWDMEAGSDGSSRARPATFAPAPIRARSIS